MQDFQGDVSQTDEVRVGGGDYREENLEDVRLESFEPLLAEIWWEVVEILEEAFQLYQSPNIQLIAVEICACPS